MVPKALFRLWSTKVGYGRCVATATHGSFVDSKADDGVRVRFAPSPTGFVHIGGLRSIAYNYIFARSRPGGRFILRIEDTDRDRIVEGAAEKLESTLSWLGLEPDESPLKGGPFGPYVQSQRLRIYQDAAATLMEGAKAYRCFCTPDRLMLLKKEALKNREGVRYDNRCRSLTNEEIEKKLKSGTPFAVRFVLRDEPSSFEDTIFGLHKYEVHVHEGDPVIMKSDGFPTYHFANVVDDHSMRITHVIRGEEWLMSTVKHLQLYAAFGWKPPSFAHLPIIMKLKGGKLSKRDEAANLDSYRENGYYPLALINFVLSTGGAFERGKDKDKLYTLDELISMFRLDKAARKSTKIEPLMLEKYNRLCMVNRLQTSELVEDLRGLVSKRAPPNSDQAFGTEQLDDTYLRRILEQYLEDERMTTLTQLLRDPDHSFLWNYQATLHPDLRSPLTVDGTAASPRDMALHLEQLTNKFDDRFAANGAAYTLEEIRTFLAEFEQTSGVSNRMTLPFIRLLLTHSTKGLPVAATFYLLGKERTIRRLRHGIAQLKSEEGPTKAQGHQMS